MSVVGTQGYENSVDSFASASFNLKFDEINADFLKFLPNSGRILDAGCGVGQNSAFFSKKGYEVVALEPLPEFLDLAKSKYSDLNITWLNDSLPKLEEVDGLFDFILVDGVWHHLNFEERIIALERFADLLQAGGICAISLQNGPAGAGTHIFPTSIEEIEEKFEELGLELVFKVTNQPSKMPNKEKVVWSRIALRKF